jgi:hypothetical protein
MNKGKFRIRIGSIFMGAAILNHSSTQGMPQDVPQTSFHLTARPWLPLQVSKDAYLDAIEGQCRYEIRLQDPSGAIIDPFQKREIQYSTPYFAFAVGTLVHAGRAGDLLENGARAMDHATECFGKGIKGIPDAHGEFFDVSLSGAIGLYKDHVSADRMKAWLERMRVPREQIVGKLTNNWRAYAMLGEWLRARQGFVDRAQTLAFIADSWNDATQRDRLQEDEWNLYQDRETDPESHAVEAVGRVNLLALIAEGYDGNVAGEMRNLVERGTAVTLLLQDPSGQCPPDGRADNHVWNDVLYQLAFEMMAERTALRGDSYRAGQYRHAAMLSFGSIARWRRSDGAWAGSYYVTKNHFDPAERVGYQPASNYSNYNGAVMLHLAQAWLARKSEIAEQPAPVEIGGYAFATDPKFSSAVANAGGMQLFAALRGDTKQVYGHYWTSLGVNRFGRVKWDSRLGPSDGVRDAATGTGVTFAPTWMEKGRWVRMADVPDRYHGQFSVQFTHPLLVRCAIDYTPIHDGDGPSFRHEFVLTPDGILATLHSSDGKEFGVTWPLLVNDGAPLQSTVTDSLATTAYPNQADQQCFLSPAPAGTIVDSEEPIQSTYGWLRPVRINAQNGVNHTFVYPRSPEDPPADRIQKSLHVTADGFESDLGSVHGTLYVGRTSAGGEGSSIDCDGDGKPDAVFDSACRFILQLRQGKISSVEADRDIDVRIADRRLHLHAYVPLTVDHTPL